MKGSLREFALAGAFQGYAYAYPHKTAYRRLDPPVPLAEAWEEEDTSALFLYVHLPFCEMRCGFCNLFTTAQPEQNFVNRYLKALEREAGVSAEALGGGARFSRLAIGGGTPTFLSVGEMESLFALLNREFKGMAGAIPKAVESSPGTLDPGKVECLRGQGVTRVSLGVQSFLENEVKTLGRRQVTAEVRRALGLLKAAGFPCVNLDLIYGIPSQTRESWRQSLAGGLEFAPQEIYLYPLYVRQLTGLERRGCSPADNRLELYRQGRDFLLERGYEQISMRLFRAADYRPAEGPVYCCQEDGMVGLGAGARSYTASLHYSTEYAVGRSGVKSIIEDYFGRSADRFGLVEYGCRLGTAEQQRRYVLKSLLRRDGLELEAYALRFGTEVGRDLPQLRELADEGWLEEARGVLRLNGAGLELSDVIGPWLCSASMKERMDAYALS